MPNYMAIYTRIMMLPAVGAGLFDGTAFETIGASWIAISGLGVLVSERIA